VPIKYLVQPQKTESLLRKLLGHVVTLLNRCYPTIVASCCTRTSIQLFFIHIFIYNKASEGK